MQRVFSFETYLFLMNLAKELDLQNLHAERVQKKVSDWWKWVQLKS